MAHSRKAGYQGLLYYGAAGAQAATLVQNCTDLNYAFAVVTDDITARGDGSAPPIEEEIAVGRTLEDLSWTMIEDDTDTTLAALKAAAATGALVALRTKSHSTGTGFDGDVYVSVKQGMPIKGRSTVDLKASKPNQKTRAASFNS